MTAACGLRQLPPPPAAANPWACWRDLRASRPWAWLVLPLLTVWLLVLPAGALAASPNPAPNGALSARGCTPTQLGGAAGVHAAPLALAGRGGGGSGGVGSGGHSLSGDERDGRGGEGDGTGGGGRGHADPATTDLNGGEAALFERALAASRAGRFAAALPLWDELLRRHPADAAAWSNRGNVRLALGDAVGAIADQEQAMALDPQHTDPHLNRGTAEEALGRWRAAAADYQWILERDPVEASALYNLGNVNGSLGDWQAAQACFSAAALARPGFAMARSSAALASFQLGELEAAERQLRALIRRYPLFADARAGLTALLWRRGASGEAESHWVAASGLDPRYRQADWLLNIRRWPPEPARSLEQFLSLS